MLESKVIKTIGIIILLFCIIVFSISAVEGINDDSKAVALWVMLDLSAIISLYQLIKKTKNNK